jgi:hypothetical protein
MRIDLNFIDGNGLNFHISMTTFVYNKSRWFFW